MGLEDTWASLRLVIARLNRLVRMKLTEECGREEDRRRNGGQGGDVTGEYWGGEPSETGNGSNTHYNGANEAVLDRRRWRDLECKSMT